MESSALAAPAVCQNPLHPHTLAHAPTRTGLRQQGGEALALAGIAHDARNLVTALRLCADLIGEPGVLAPAHDHFAGEVRSIAEATQRLVKRLSTLSHSVAQPHDGAAVEAPIDDLARAIRELSGLLAALAGPSVGLQIACLPCHGQLRLSEESLTRILLNLVRNAADAMPDGGRIRITAQRGTGGSFFWSLPADHAINAQEADRLWDDQAADGRGRHGTVLLTVEDNGPGIPRELQERIFEPGYSTRRTATPWSSAPHQGLGLSIVRQLVEEAGGTVRAVRAPGRGARFEIELPLTNVTPSLLSERALLAGNEG